MQDPLNLSIPRANSETRLHVLTDPEQPGVEFHFVFGTLTNVENFGVVDILQAFKQKYIVPNKDEVAPPFPPVGGQAIDAKKFGDAYLMSIALVFMSQRQKEKFSMEQLIALSLTMPNGWTKLMDTVTSMTVAKDKEEISDDPLARQQAVIINSESTSLELTPESSIEPTTFSEESISALEKSFSP